MIAGINATGDTGHWKGWALEIETFLGPEMATNEHFADVIDNGDESR
jgi:hypothetical protein